MSFNTDIMLLSMSYIQVLSTGPVMFFFKKKKKTFCLYWHIADWCIRIAESLCYPLETITIITTTIITSTALPLSPCNLISCHTHTHICPTSKSPQILKYFWRYNHYHTVIQVRENTDLSKLPLECIPTSIFAVQSDSHLKGLSLVWQFSWQ